MQVEKEGEEGGVSALEETEKQWGAGGSESQNASDTCSQTQAIYLWGKEPEELLSRQEKKKSGVEERVT